MMAFPHPARIAMTVTAILGTAAVIALIRNYLDSSDKKKRESRRASMRRASIPRVHIPMKAQKHAAHGAPSASAQKGMLMKGRVIEGAKIGEIQLFDIETLRGKFPSADVPNGSRKKAQNHSGENIKYNKIIGNDAYILKDIVRKPNSEDTVEAFLRAGPRSITHFDPSKVVGAVVTCGGLCPGLNNVIREVVHSLIYLYGAKRIIGIRGGYNGFCDPTYKPMDLTPENTAECHHAGGTILASSRGGFDSEKIIAFLVKHGINQLYVIGGDGTHRGAYLLSQECIARGLNISVVGIPKTIDNDVDLIDRSFGFQTSVEAAQDAIRSAHIEAQCNMPNGVGIVKLMGRSSGFIAAHATLGSGDVDLCLLPEILIELDGPNGCLPFLMKRVQEKGYAVVVVAEGAGEELLGESAEVDAGGNRKLPAIGEYLADKLRYYFAQYGQVVTVKNIDPSYMIRSVPANASDAVYCMLLGQNAVHGAMAGYTNITVGVVNNHLVYIPIPLVVATSPRVLDVFGRTWDRVLSITRQPEYSPKSVYSNVGRKD